MLKLPRPDPFGNFWWNKEDKDHRSAIFPSKGLNRKGEILPNGTFFILVNGEILMDRTSLLRFHRLQDALEKLDSILNEVAYSCKARR